MAGSAVGRTAAGRRDSSRTPTSLALARIAREAVGHLTGPERTRLRACSDETCGGIFLDESGRRRWCSDSLFGSRARVRAHRARARTQ
ncbi:CGNR zinc finger domain-containing protein [Jatrophihabitans cynanchi]|uniref:CGNR zinc finger domain-containing protein n=1 Tax=Jatrophihabitans cynanchi TaxID=2944128 RepID=UPI0038B28615